jgi:hypothetical protein
MPAMKIIRSKYTLALLLLLALGVLIPTHFVSASWFDLGSIASKAITKILATIIAWLTYAVGYTLLPLAASLVNLGFTWSDSILTSQIVPIGWTLTRDLANMFFILIFLVIAFATIMRFESYGMKSLLTRFLIAALLINFSLVIGGFFIDVGGDLGKFFTTGYVGAEDTGWDTDISASMMNALGMNYLLDNSNRQRLASEDIFQGGEGGNEGLAVLTSAVFSFVMILVVAFLFVFIAALLFFRMVALWILLILAPIAWISLILPPTRNIWSKWWHQFMSWSFLPAVVGFFIYLGVLIASKLNASTLLQDANYVANIHGSFPFGGQIRYLLQYIAILIILWFGVVVAKSWSATGSEILFKGADAARNWALGRVKAGGMWAARTGGGTAIQVVPATARRSIREGLEKAPIFGRWIGGPGARFKKQREMLEEARKGMEGLSEDEKRAIMNETSTTPEGLARRAAAFESLAQERHLRDEDYNFRYLKQFEEAGGDLDMVMKLRPDWAYKEETWALMAKNRKMKHDWEGILKITDGDKDYEVLDDLLAAVQGETEEETRALREAEGWRFNEKTKKWNEIDTATGEVLSKKEKAVRELIPNELVSKDHAGHAKTLKYASVSPEDFKKIKEAYDAEIAAGRKPSRELKAKFHMAADKYRFVQRDIGDYKEKVHTFNVTSTGELQAVNRAGFYGPTHWRSVVSTNPQFATRQQADGGFFVKTKVVDSSGKTREVMLAREGLPDGLVGVLHVGVGGVGKQTEAAGMARVRATTGKEGLVHAVPESYTAGHLPGGGQTDRTPRAPTTVRGAPTTVQNEDTEEEEQLEMDLGQET